MERVDRIAGLISVIIDLLDKLAESLHLGDDSILVLHDGQLAVKQTDKLSAELIALILDLELLFIVGNVVDYCIDLCCFLFNLLVEIFTLCLLLSKLTFDLSHTLRDVFTEARADIDKAGAFFNTRALKKSTEYVNDVFNHIREVMRDDWNFDFNSESDMKAFRLSFDKIIIRGNERNDIYTVADTALVNFFYDFSFAIHKMKLYVCKCKYCGKVFLGKKNAVACEAENCQATYQHEVKNAKRRKRENGTYKVYSTRLSNYIGQQKTKLPAEVLDDPALVEKYDQQRKVFTKQMQDKLDEYEAENRLPDEELSAFYEKMKQDVMSFVYALEAEAE